MSDPKQEKDQLTSSYRTVGCRDYRTIGHVAGSGQTGEVEQEHDGQDVGIVLGRQSGCFSL